MPTSEYEDSRRGSLNAAIDLFGSTSQQFTSVLDAWNAVVTRAFHHCQPVGHVNDVLGAAMLDIGDLRHELSSLIFRRPT